MSVRLVLMTTVRCICSVWRAGGVRLVGDQTGVCASVFHIGLCLSKNLQVVKSMNRMTFSVVVVWCMYASAVCHGCFWLWSQNVLRPTSCNSFWITAANTFSARKKYFCATWPHFGNWILIRAIATYTWARSKPVTVVNSLLSSFTVRSGNDCHLHLDIQVNYESLG